MGPAGMRSLTLSKHLAQEGCSPLRPIVSYRWTSLHVAEKLYSRAFRSIFTYASVCGLAALRLLPKYGISSAHM